MTVASSLGLPTRPSGIPLTKLAIISGVENTSWNGVSITPGDTAFARTPWGANSLASDLVNAIRPALAVEYDDIVAIEEQFERDTVSNVAEITEIGEYLRAGGGKRIRPALLLLSAKLLGYKGKGAVKLATVVEIIHTATLVHADIIDEAQIRRGRPAANTQWGNSMCVLAGDWLYMQAFRVAVQHRNFRILDVLVELTQQLVEGELLQMEKLGQLISLQEHLDLIYRKTACLFSVCMRFGGILGGATAIEEERL